MPQRRVLEVLIVLLHPDERQIAGALIPDRHTVVGGQQVRRLAQIATVRMAVYEDRVDAGRFLNEVEAAFDAFVEYRVRPNLHADHRARLRLCGDADAGRCVIASIDRGHSGRLRSREHRDQFLNERAPIVRCQIRSVHERTSI